MPNATDETRRRFEEALPLMDRVARSRLRIVRDPSLREDLHGETIAMAWQTWLVSTSKGKAPWEFACRLAWICATRALTGARVAGSLDTQDVLNPFAQRARGFGIAHLSALTGDEGRDIVERLADDSETPPPDQAAFRIDFAEWMQARSDDERRLICARASGLTDEQAARRLRRGEGALRNMRVRLANDWERYQR